MALTPGRQQDGRQPHVTQGCQRQKWPLVAPRSHGKRVAAGHWVDRRGEGREASEPKADSELPRWLGKTPALRPPGGRRVGCTALSAKGGFTFQPLVVISCSRAGGGPCSQRGSRLARGHLDLIILKWLGLNVWGRGEGTACPPPQPLPASTCWLHQSGIEHGHPRARKGRL